MKKVKNKKQKLIWENFNRAFGWTCGKKGIEESFKEGKKNPLVIDVFMV